jgi:DNA-binding NarL/FixJ family response regulator
VGERRCVLVSRDRLPGWAVDFPLPLVRKSPEDIERAPEALDVCVIDTNNTIAHARSLRARHDTCGVVAIANTIDGKESAQLLAAGADEVVFRDSLDHVALLRAMRSAFERRTVISQLIATRLQSDRNEKLAAAALSGKANLLALVNTWIPK